MKESILIKVIPRIPYIPKEGILISNILLTNNPYPINEIDIK